MSAVISREHAKTAGLTAAAGMLLLAVAVVMMVMTAPVHEHVRLSGFSKPSATQFATDACHQLTSRSNSATVRACLAGPAAESA